MLADAARVRRNRRAAARYLGLGLLYGKSLWEYDESDGCVSGIRKDARSNSGCLDDGSLHRGTRGSILSRVTAARKRFSIFPAMIPWSQIASCDLLVLRDTVGATAIACPVINDADRKDLFCGLVMG